MFMLFVLSVIGIALLAILFVLITTSAKASKRKNLISRLANADIFLSDGLCNEAQKALTEVMQQLFTSGGDPIFPDLVLRCFYDNGRYWNLCGKGSKSAIRESINNYEKCLDFFDKLNDDERTSELANLKYECEYRLGLLYLDEAEGMPSARRAKPLLMAEKFLLAAMNNIEVLSNAIRSDTVVAKPELLSARIRYALAKTYHLLSWNGKESREMYLAKCVANASGAIEDCFSRNDYPAEWEQMVKLRTEVSIELCDYGAGEEYVDACVDFQNEYIAHLRSAGQLTDAFFADIRLGDFLMKAAKPKAPLGKIATEGNRYELNIRSIFGDPTDESPAGDVVKLRRNIEAARNSYDSALALSSSAMVPKDAIGGAYRKKTRALIAMYGTQANENYLIDAVAATQPCLDYYNNPADQAEILLILGKLFIMLGNAKSEEKEKDELFINAQRTYKQAVDLYIRENDIDGRRYAEEMLREIAFIKLQAEA
ncbi:MAG: hypothetical protein HQL08_09490 [Nitrospirae bacterium]|nr:hypothetical protein [Nitrospirota bacterium]